MYSHGKSDFEPNKPANEPQQVHRQQGRGPGTACARRGQLAAQGTFQMTPKLLLLLAAAAATAAATPGATSGAPPPPVVPIADYTTLVEKVANAPA